MSGAAITVIRLLTGLTISTVAKESGIALEVLQWAEEGGAALEDENRASLARLLFERSSSLERDKLRWRVLEETWGTESTALAKWVAPMRRRRTMSIAGPFFVLPLLLAFLGAVSSGNQVAIGVTGEAIVILLLASMILLSGGIPYDIDVFLFFTYHLYASDKFRATREFLFTWMKEKAGDSRHYDSIFWAPKKVIQRTAMAVCARAPLNSLPEELPKRFREDLRGLLYAFSDFGLENFPREMEELDRFEAGYDEVVRPSAHFEFPPISRRTGGSIIAAGLVMVVFLSAYLIGRASGEWTFAGILVAGLVPSVLWFADRWFFRTPQ